VLEIGREHGIAAIPGEGEDPAAFYSTLGRPAKPEDYTLPEYSDEGIEVDFDEANALRPVAHQLGLTDKQFHGMVKAATDQRLEGFMDLQRRVAADKAVLTKAWGEATEMRLAQIEKFLEVNQAPAALVAAAKARNLDSASASWLYNLMDTMGGESAEVAAQGKRGGTNVLTPAEALERVGEIERKMADLPQGSEEYNHLMRRRIDLITIAGN